MRMLQALRKGKDPIHCSFHMKLLEHCTTSPKTWWSNWLVAKGFLGSNCYVYENGGWQNGVYFDFYYMFKCKEYIDIYLPPFNGKLQALREFWSKDMNTEWFEGHPVFQVHIYIYMDAILINFTGSDDFNKKIAFNNVFSWTMKVMDPEWVIPLRLFGDGAESYRIPDCVICLLMGHETKNSNSMFAPCSPQTFASWVNVDSEWFMYRIFSKKKNFGSEILRTTQVRNPHSRTASGSQLCHHGQQDIAPWLMIRCGVLFSVFGI